MKCQECDNELTGRQKHFCSNSCKNKPNGRKIGGLNNKRVTLKCDFCGKNYEVPPCRVATSRHCSILCHNTAISRESIRPVRKYSYRDSIKSKCERCESNKFLLVHHKNRNRQDNVIENLETLCKRCHQIEHDCIKNLGQYAK